jgi:hypothetical protein
VSYLEDISRKFDHCQQQIEAAAFRTLQQTLRPKPFLLPYFLSRLVQALALKIAFK